MTEEKIKDLINREYMIYFNRDRKADIYREDTIFYRPYSNPVNRKFSFTF